ncbi:MAG: DNA internalization-related competence protein ComEC/Rec2 [Roseateles depolymerans]|uniref:DNA internalization-related competence protein ComEC/Rec2 n=1 Tax=Roseateles depolymerans TaxID=76731 RepID=A0A2W5FUR2_9BURK|nr:MAG: DNA internalization-related competence protein ComEC/Rec2 [Roseateles depolymerans]
MLGLAWLAGLGLLHQFERLPAQTVLAGLALLGAALLMLGPWMRRKGRVLPALALGVAAVALLALAQGAWRAQLRLADELDPAWEQRDLTLTGRVDSLPVAVVGVGGQPGWRFEFAVQALWPDPSAPGARPRVPSRLMLAAYGGEPVRAGERWRLVVRLKRPHGLSNPGGLDAELWLFEQGLRATGVVRPQGAQRLEAASPWSLDGARQRLRQAISQHVTDPTAAGVLAALSLGDQNAIASQDWALFRDTGVAHLLSVSGLHVTLFAWLAGGLAGALWRRMPALCLRCPAPWVARWAGAAAALAYALFSGWGVPAQRTVWMLVALAGLSQLGLRWPWPLQMLLVAVIVTGLDPWALLQPGFWLSFGAVALLMSAGDAQVVGWRQRLMAGLRTQLLACLGLAPLSVLCFGQWSLVGLLANLVAIPLVSYVLMPLALLGALWAPLWTLAAQLVQALLAYLGWLATWPGAVWWLPAAPAWAVPPALLGAVLAVLRLPWSLRLMAVPLMLPLLWPVVPRPHDGEFELTAPDIGQGNAVLLRTREHALLFDAGPTYGPGSDAGERVLLPMLRRQGVRRLDELMLSHRDSDHVGGAAALLRALPVGLLRSSLEPGHPLRALGAPTLRCEAGQRWAWDGVTLEVLHPRPADYDARLKPNDLSCVLRVRSASGRTALLMGDLQAGQELALVARTADLRADWLLVPHHGSKTSSSPALLAAVRPELALVQAGYRNRFGHPALPVLARYRAANIAVIGSPACGQWRWDSAMPLAQASCERQARPRYWQDRLGPWEPGASNSADIEDAAGAEPGPQPEWLP